MHLLYIETDSCEDLDRGLNIWSISNMLTFLWSVYNERLCTLFKMVSQPKSLQLCIKAYTDKIWFYFTNTGISASNTQYFMIINNLKLI